MFRTCTPGAKKSSLDLDIDVISVDDNYKKPSVCLGRAMASVAHNIIPSEVFSSRQKYLPGGGAYEFLRS